MTRGRVFLSGAIVFTVLVMLIGTLTGDGAVHVRTMSTSETTTTVAVETMPSLPASFGKLVKRGHRADTYRPGRAAGFVNGHPCGGDLPPCWVMRRESNGDLHAYNPDGCNGHGCYGLWQCDPTTCDGTGSEAEQNAEARRVWDHGRGCEHWNAC